MSVDQGPSESSEPIILTNAQGRLLLIGYLTSAANALAMGGSADAFAQEQVVVASALLDAFMSQKGSRSREGAPAQHTALPLEELP